MPLSKRINSPYRHRLFLTDDATLDALCTEVAAEVEDTDAGKFVSLVVNLDIALGDGRAVDSVGINGYIEDPEDRQRIAEECAAAAEKLLTLQASFNSFCNEALHDLSALLGWANGTLDTLPAPRATT
jgi:hypothetical protein